MPTVNGVLPASERVIPTSSVEGRAGVDTTDIPGATTAVPTRREAASCAQYRGALREEHLAVLAGAASRG